MKKHSRGAWGTVLAMAIVPTVGSASTSRAETTYAPSEALTCGPDQQQACEIDPETKHQTCECVDLPPVVCELRGAPIENGTLSRVNMTYWTSEAGPSQLVVEYYEPNMEPWDYEINVKIVGEFTDYFKGDPTVTHVGEVPNPGFINTSIGEHHEYPLGNRSGRCTSYFVGTSDWWGLSIPGWTFTPYVEYRDGVASDQRLRAQRDDGSVDVMLLPGY